MIYFSKVLITVQIQLKIAKFMEQSPSREADSQSSNQDIPSFHGNRKFVTVTYCLFMSTIR